MYRMSVYFCDPRTATVCGVLGVSGRAPTLRVGSYASTLWAVLEATAVGHARSVRALGGYFYPTPDA